MERTGRIAIGAVSKHTGINVETIRFYERAGCCQRRLGVREATVSMAPTTSSG